MSPQNPAGRWVGEWVEATTLSPEFDVDGEPTDSPAPSQVKGILTVVYVGSLDYWRFSVAGLSVVPDSVRPP